MYFMVNLTHTYINTHTHVLTRNTNPFLQLSSSYLSLPKRWSLALVHCSYVLLWSHQISMCVQVYIHINIDTHMHTCTCIYIYTTKHILTYSKSWILLAFHLSPHLFYKPTALQCFPHFFLHRTFTPISVVTQHTLPGKASRRIMPLVYVVFL